jgi:ribosomal-protein-alanine N-acetyltransferase
MSQVPTAEVAPSRLIRVDDAEALADMLARNREFLAPWTPLWPDDFATVARQRADIDSVLQRHAQGTVLPHVVLGDGGEVVGRIALNDIVRGPFQSCRVNYWVSQHYTGRGLATAAMAHIKALAFGELGLHRLQAETLVHNAASQAVLARNGFERIGVAPAFFKIAGRWQDHIMFQTLNPDM